MGIHSKSAMTIEGEAPAKKAGGGVVLFNVSKKERFHPGHGYKKWHRRLRSNHKIQSNKEELTLDTLKDASVAIFGGPQDMFTTPEFECIKQYLAEGGNVMLMLGEGGETKFGTNVNYLLEEYGISVNSDAVVRTVYHKSATNFNRYLHPKEVFINTGVLNREVSKGAKKQAEQSGDDSLPFVYPYGATLNVQKPAVPILSTGFISHPLNRPVAAVFTHKGGEGRLLVVGSVHMFHDDYIDKEENSCIVDFCMSWLRGATTGNGVGGLNHLDAEDPEVNDYLHLPDTAAMSINPRSCLQEPDEIPTDFTQLFDSKLFCFDTDLIPEAVKLYSKLNVPKKPLTLITPEFELPLPPLAPAVFTPQLREGAAPPLELYDLDEEFASDRVRLSHLTNKCSDDDLEYFVREAGEMLGICSQLEQSERGDPRAILYHTMVSLANWKKLHS